MNLHYKLLIIALVLFHQWELKGAAASDIQVELIDLPPYVIEQGNGQKSGVFIEIAHLIAKESGLPTTYRISPLSRALENLSRGLADWTLLLQSDWTEKTFLSAALVYDKVRVVVLPRKNVQLRSYEDLKSVNIAAPHGMVLGHYFDNDGTLKKSFTDNYFQSAIMLKAKRVEAMAGVEASLYFAAKNVGLKRSELGSPLVLRHSNFKLFFASDRLSDTQKEAIISATNRLRLSGAFEKIFTKYLSVE